MWRKLLLTASLLSVAASNDCVPRKSVESGEDDGHYCVCNATYCDDTPSVTKQQSGSAYSVISSSKSGLRFRVSHGKYGNATLEETNGRISIDRSKKYQEIIGFGSSVTDSAAITIKSLSHDAADRLLRSYFGPDGTEYNVLRTHMGGCDFSTRPYSYAMVENDTRLHHFKLQPEDIWYKIPILKSAFELSKTPISLMTTAWSASPWMKTADTWSNAGKLRPEYRQLWADYFVKYFKAYKDHGIKFWAVTPQNEPAIYKYIKTDINGMAWTAEEQRDWVIDYLEPSLRKAQLHDIKILVCDDSRYALPDWTKTILEDDRARAVVAGTAVHWYVDTTEPASVLDETKRLFPEKILMSTEACTGSFEEKKVILGSWRRGELYGKDIIQNMLHWVSGWIDWNMALNLEGGPNWCRNFVDSPIIVNATADEFYKQPMYYFLGHFSKYVPRGSVRIGTEFVGLDKDCHVAFITPDGAIVLVLLNTDTEEKIIGVEDPRKGTTKLTLPPKSIHTMKYW